MIRISLEQPFLVLCVFVFFQWQQLYTIVLYCAACQSSTTINSSPKVRGRSSRARWRMSLLLALLAWEKFWRAGAGASYTWGRSNNSSMFSLPRGAGKASDTLLRQCCKRSRANVSSRVDARDAVTAHTIGPTPLPCLETIRLRGTLLLTL
jgi:hypothetical protein